MMCIVLLFVTISGTRSDELSGFTVLYPYKDYSSTSIFRHEVPVATKQATWRLQAENRYPHSCEDVNVTV